jgi:hypothetical protein
MQSMIPLYMGFLKDWLAKRTFMISKGCIASTWDQPDTHPQ